MLGAINVSWSAYQMYEEPSFSNGFSLTRNIIGMASWEYGLVDTYISLSWNESKNRAKQSVENISKGLLLILEYLTQFMEFQIIQAIYLWILIKNFTIKKINKSLRN